MTLDFEERCKFCSGQVEQLVEGLTSNYTRDRELPTFSLLYCKACDVAITHPFPSPASLAQIYSESYAYGAHRAIRREKRKRARDTLRRVEKHFGLPTRGPKTQTALSLIDLGCGEGVLVQEASLRGYQAVGVDYAAPSSNTQRLIQKDLSEFLNSYDGPRFDVVVMSHVLEHMSEPGKTIEQIAANIAHDKSVLIFLVPNRGSRTIKVLRKKWGYWQVPVHLFHFNLNSLSELFNRHGLKVTGIEFRGADSLFWILTAGNFFGLKSKGANSFFGRTLMRVSSSLLAPWMLIGEEDLIFFATPSAKD